MNDNATEAQGSAARQVPPMVAAMLPGFEDLSALWEGDAALFESETQVRWLVHTRREALAKADALAKFERRVYVHRERFLAVMRQEALRKGGRPQ